MADINPAIRAQTGGDTGTETSEGTQQGLFDLSRYPKQRWWAALHAYRGLQKPDEPQIDLYRAADKLLMQYPVLEKLYVHAQINDEMVRHAHKGATGLSPKANPLEVWEITDIGLTDQEQEQSSQLLDMIMDLETENQDLRVWLIQLFGSRDELRKCERCGKYRNQRHVTQDDDKFFCNQVISVHKGFTPYSSTVTQDCYTPHMRDKGNLAWLGSAICPCCKQSLTFAKEVTKNSSDEVISAICNTCRIQVHRPASGLQSTIPAEIARLINNAGKMGPDHNPFFC